MRDYTGINHQMKIIEIEYKRIARVGMYIAFAAGLFLGWLIP